MQLLSKIFLLTLSGLLSFQGAFGQSVSKKYIVFFKDKNNSIFNIDQPSKFLSQRAIDRRTRQNILVTKKDIPVNNNYVDSIKSTGAKVLHTSKWFNSATVCADSLALVKISKFAFVINNLRLTKRMQKLDMELYPDFTPYQKPSLANHNFSDSASFGPSYTQAHQLGINDMHDAGYKGEGMVIAVIDAGFSQANTLTAFQRLFNTGRILGAYDFVENDTSVYDAHSHGMQVLSTLGGYAPGMLVGSAYNASFYLLRSEDVGSENPVEEANWIAAAEYADSAGADILTTSLGYSNYDDSTMSYTYKNMDGATTLITKGADLAAATGMLVINAAGNEAGKAWRHIIAPADGDSVLAVGAVNPDGDYAYFSSLGPSYDGRIKPNVSSQGQGVTVWTTSDSILTYGSGTSFATPILAGLAAGLWQAHPDKTNMQIIDMLQRAGTQANAPDSLLGYGIPNFNRAQALSIGQDFATPEHYKFSVYPNPFSDALFFNLESEKNNNYWLRITNPYGQLLFHKTYHFERGRHLRSLDIKALPKGIYFIELSDGGARINFRVVKF